MGAAELILIRHGQSTGNVARAAAEAAGEDVMAVGCRDADVPLSELGRLQAQATGRWLASLGPTAAPVSAWASPYLRARDTATLALDTWGTAAGTPAGSPDVEPIPLRIDERLRDKELGILDMLTFTGMQNRFPIEFARRQLVGKFYYRAPGGESWADLALRLRSVLHDIDIIEDGKRVVVFTHDAMVFLFRYVCENLDEAELQELSHSTVIANTSVTRMMRIGSDGPWMLAEFNDTSHLGVELCTDHR